MEGSIMADLRASGLGGTPFGETAARPSSPSIGQTFYNGSNGLLEIYTASGWIALAGAPPAIPVSVVPTNQGSGRAYNNGSASVAFASGSGGGLSGEYVVTSTPGNYFAIGSSSPIIVSGLQSNTSYTFAAQARNNFGTSISSTSSSPITATTTPQSPSIIGVTDTVTGGTVSLSFTAGATGGSSITNYKYSTDGTTFTALSPSQTTSPLTISGLTNNTSYTFYIKAVNENGDSTSSSISSSVTPSLVLQNTYLVVGGGGPGGSGLAGGGGAGGYRTNYNTSTIAMSAGITYTATVGGGGAGSASNQSQGANGVNSSIIGGAISISSTGGGSGGYYANEPPQSGGSGGGGGGTGASGNAGGYSPSEGNSGGRGNYWGSSKHLGGGGGGAGGAGSDTPNGSIGGQGGAGVSNSITGTALFYAGGGGGCGRNSASSAGGLGGSGIGGRGAGTNTGSAGVGGSGTTNTGSGGGGGDYADGSTSPQGGNGGSGVVIIRTLGTAVSTTGSPTVITDGSYKVYQFNSTGTITF
jgi:hypothetical protein